MHFQPKPDAALGVEGNVALLVELCERAEQLPLEQSVHFLTPDMCAGYLQELTSGLYWANPQQKELLERECLRLGGAHHWISEQQMIVEERYVPEFRTQYFRMLHSKFTALAPKF